MKRLILIYFLFLSPNFMFGQTLNDTISLYFDEVKKATKKNFNVWDKNLYGSILLVNPQTRDIFANESDTAGVLKLDGKIYKGQLPNNINVANTALSWNGKTWAMIMLPLPSNKEDRINLMAHEAFHVVQKELGFTLFNADNNHLDQKDGRIYLKLELEALRKAALANDFKKQKIHVTHALTFRKYRYELYPEAAKTENQLELNEGLAEYTGFIVSNRNKKQAKLHFDNHIDAFLLNPTFVRSFAYETVPIYGSILRGVKKGWHLDMKNDTDLTDYFIRTFGIKIKENLKEEVKIISSLYNGVKITEEETQREEKTKQLIADYKKKYVEQAHLEIPFIAMNMSFDPRNIMPLENYGIVYPNIRITDNWGILTVEKGALVSANWDKITLVLPFKEEVGKVIGDGWVLELKPNYEIKKDEKSDSFILKLK